jgi:hypothetical protein
MKNTSFLKSRWFLPTAIVLLVCLVRGPIPARAQICPATAIAGNNTVYEICSSAATTIGSSAFVDAGAFDTNTNDDICAKIHSALGAASTVAGTVIDARGVLPSSGTTQPCVTDPFSGITKPSTVLLPAGTITMSTAWAIPGTTQVIGEGPGVTTLQASSTSFSDAYSTLVNPAMIHMGVPNTSTPYSKNLVFAVRLVHLTLDGQGQKIGTPYIDGIDNDDAEEQSYVDDVTINNILGNGLSLGIDPGGSGDGAADHSGPYTNILFQETTSSAVAGTACLNVAAGTQPRGLHGITCAASTTATAGIILDGSNVTIEDARIDGFQDGILIGDHPVSGQGPAQVNLLFNVVGTNSVGSTTNLVHIASSSTPTPLNLTLMGITSAAGNTIKDDLTATQLTNSSDPYVGLYVVGHPFYNSSSVVQGYSRFTTTPRFPAWLVGSTSAAISGSCSNGSLFSSTTGTGGTLWTCVSGSWSKIQ